jgi:hypothetical protein
MGEGEVAGTGEAKEEQHATSDVAAKAPTASLTLNGTQKSFKAKSTTTSSSIAKVPFCFCAGLRLAHLILHFGLSVL